MPFEWANEKATEDVRKHRIRFEDAVEVFSFFNIVTGDPVAYDGEERFIAIGLIGHRPVTVVYTEGDGATRIISARRSSRAEAERLREAFLERFGPPG